MKKLPPSDAESLIADAQALGMAIRHARRRAGLSLEDAALQLGIAKQTLGNLETKGTVGLETALRAARELGVSLFAVPSSEREPVRRAIAATRRELARALEPSPAKPRAEDKR